MYNPPSELQKVPGACGSVLDVQRVDEDVEPEAGGCPQLQLALHGRPLQPQDGGLAAQREVHLHNQHFNQ